MVTSNSKLGCKHGKASKPGVVYSFSTGGPAAEHSDFLSCQDSSRRDGLLGYNLFPIHWLASSGAGGMVCGRMVCAAHTLGSLKGFSVANQRFKGKGGK